MENQCDYYKLEKVNDNENNYVLIKKELNILSKKKEIINNFYKLQKEVDKRKKDELLTEDKKI